MSYQMCSASIISNHLAAIRKGDFLAPILGMWGSGIGPFEKIAKMLPVDESMGIMRKFWHSILTFYPLPFWLFHIFTFLPLDEAMASRPVFVIIYHNCIGRAGGNAFGAS